MHTFEITIQRKFAGDWPVVGLRDQGDGVLPIRTEGTLKLDVAELEKRIVPRDYGMFLGKALFEGEVLRAFDRARANSEDRLHVLLFIEDSELRKLRWERLCAPFESDLWDFLCLNQRVPFSLYLPSTTDRRFPPISRDDLRTLILAASPKNLSTYSLAEFDAGAAAANIRAALGDIPSDILAVGQEAIGLPTLNALTKSISASGYYPLLHLICHGQYDSDSGETTLYLANDEDEVADIAGADLILELNRLGGSKGLPHFVFLSACEAGTPEAEQALGSLANRLVRELGIPAVVAMTGEISMATAGQLSRAFYESLRQHGQVDLALVEAYAGLTNRDDINVPALYSRLGGRPLFSESIRKELTSEQLELGLGELQRLLDERAPAMRPAFDAQAENLRNLIAHSPSADEKQKNEAIAELSAISLEVADLAFPALVLGAKPAAYDNRCPFRGLFAFQVKDQDFFFGRERLIEKLASKLQDSNFLAVLGPSGSGKSSVVLAGLIPALQTSRTSVASMTPGAEPLATLKLKLRQIELSSDPILVIDQFEELFTHWVTAAERQEFLTLLLSQSEIKVVVTMRADFWGECAPYTELKERMQANQELIAPMDAAALRRAMELQAAKVGLRFEADLSSQILDDVQNEPGAMPLLQHALQELWKRRHGRWLRADEYRNLGGVKMSIARTADEVYDKLSEKDKEQVKAIFLRLTRLDEDDAEGGERRDTRQRVRLQSLVPADGDLSATRALVKLIADARLVVTSLNPRTSQQEVEVAHEALIRYWPKLRDWLNGDRIGLLLHRSLMRAAEEWEQNSRDTSYLYKGVRLAHAKKWAVTNLNSLNSLEREFLFASILEEGTEIGEWIKRYGSPEQTLGLARKYIAAEPVHERMKGLTILGSVSDSVKKLEIDDLLLEVLRKDNSDAFNRAAEVISDRGLVEWLVEQLSRSHDKNERQRLIRALGHIRNRPGVGVQVELAARKILPRSLRRAVTNAATARHVYTYRAQFAIVLSFTFIAVQFSLEGMSRLVQLIERILGTGADHASLPYGVFNLIATALCGLYVLLRSTLDRRPITVRSCLRAGLLGTLLSEFIFILGRLVEELSQTIVRGNNPLRGLLSTFLNTIDTLIAMMIVALVLRVLTHPKLPYARFLGISVVASAVAIFWQRIVTGAIFILGAGGPFNFRLGLTPIWLSLLLGITITFASFVGFRFGVFMSADSALFGALLGLDSGSEKETDLPPQTKNRRDENG